MELLVPECEDTAVRFSFYNGVSLTLNQKTQLAEVRAILKCC